VDSTYESQTAAVKEKYLWTVTSKCTKPADWGTVAGIFQESVKTSFDDVSDVMPPGRFKYIHTVGAVATVAFVPSGETHKFTGLFSSGAQHGLLRLSTATQIDGSQAITPGFGLKLLIDGKPSVNVLAMPSLDGQVDFNVLSLNYSNHLSYPTSWAASIVAKKFTQASNCPLMVGLSDIATYTEDGTLVTSVVMPFELIFVPNSEIKAFPSAPYGDADFLSYAEMFIDQDSILFEVYGRTSPHADDVGDVHLGSIKTTSKFTRSTFGDTQLFFTHQYMEHDFVQNPDWLPSMDIQNSCGTSEVDPLPPQSPRERVMQGEHISDGKAGRGCPFANSRGGGKGGVGCPFLRAQARQKKLEQQQHMSENTVA